MSTTKAIPTVQGSYGTVSVSSASPRRPKYLRPAQRFLLQTLGHPTTSVIAINVEAVAVDVDLIRRRNVQPVWVISPLFTTTALAVSPTPRAIQNSGTRSCGFAVSFAG